MTCRDDLGPHVLSNTVVAPASNRKIGEENFRAFRFPFWIQTIVFDIRPSDPSLICVDWSGCARVSQKNLWKKICGDQGRVGDADLVGHGFRGMGIWKF